MTEQRPDTDDRHEPGGTPTTGRGDLTDRPVTPGSETTQPSAVPGVYSADDDDRERGRDVKPGN
jgi:hypothetical protein